MSNPISEQVYKFICDYIAACGQPPSQREIAENCYLARSSVHDHLKRLEKQGRIIRDHGKKRGITFPK